MQRGDAAQQVQHGEREREGDAEAQKNIICKNKINLISGKLISLYEITWKEVEVEQVPDAPEVAD